MSKKDKLEPQLPAEGILTISDYGTSKIYKVDCTCGNEDDAITFEVDVDDYYNITVNTWTVQKTSWWDDPFKQTESINKLDPYSSWWTINYFVRAWLNSIAHRCKITWQVWTKGYVRYNSSTIMTRQQALNYAATLQQAVKECETVAELGKKNRDNKK
jgi:hypothetical protein